MFTITKNESGYLASFMAYRDEKVVGRANINYKPSLNILRIDNFAPTIKGIGTALMLAIILESLQRGNEGKVQLSSFPNALGFYWKMGFRIDPKENFFPRRNALKLETLEKRMNKYHWGLEHPQVKNNKTFLKVRTVLARRLNKSEEEIDVFNEYKKRRIYKLSDKLKKKIESAKPGERPNTASLDGAKMFLPLPAIEIWKKIIEYPETKEANFKRLLEIEQPARL